MAEPRKFLMGRLDHVHIRVPDEQVQTDPIEHNGISPVRYWPRELYDDRSKG